ncbi:MAG: diacylglycerol/polyprenol kinase family protein [Spirochaetaceae bacterium]
MHNWIGIIFSFAFVFSILGIAQLLAALRIFSPPVTRKFVHIGVSHWWLIAIPFFDSVAFALIGPVAFILLNAFSLKRQLFSAMEMPQEPGKPFNLGTVFFPVSLLLLVLITFLTEMPRWIGGMAMLILGWGDGMAAIAGMPAGTRRYAVFGQRKSLLGSVAMFLFALTILLIYSYIHLPVSTGHIWLASVTTALIATAVEGLTPLGLDNLTVPILVAFFYYGVFL